MTPVRQTIGGVRGDCWRACVASVLEVPLADVPEFAGAAWADEFRSWCRARDWSAWFSRGDEKPLGEQPPATGIASQRLGSGRIHAVVVERGAIIHDPALRPLGHERWPVVLWTFLERIP